MVFPQRGSRRLGIAVVGLPDKRCVTENLRGRLGYQLQSGLVLAFGPICLDAVVGPTPINPA